MLNFYYTSSISYNVDSLNFFLYCWAPINYVLHSLQDGTVKIKHKDAILIAIDIMKQYLNNVRQTFNTFFNLFYSK